MRKWGIIALGVFILLRMAFSEIISPDLFWHLKMGGDFLKAGLTPFVDHYSFTFLGAPIRRVAWPFQIIISLFYGVGGFAGIGAFRFVVWIVALLLLLNVFRRMKVLWPLEILGVFFYLLVTIFHSEPRPDLVSLPLELLTIILFLSWKKTGSPVLAGLLAVLLALWSNYHVSSVMGFVIAGAFIIDRALTLALHKDKTAAVWIRFILSSLLITSSGFLNHDLVHPLVGQSYVAPWANYIAEYITRPFFEQELYLQIYWILLMLAVPFLILEREFAGLVILIVMATKTWSMSKLFPHLILMTCPFVFFGLSRGFEFLSKQVSRFSRVTIAIAAGILAVVLFCQIFVATFLKPIHPWGIGISSTYFPVDAVQFIEKHKFEGRILNEYGLGGYLMFTVFPQFQIYIDGRTSILYPIEFMERYTDLSTQPNLLIDEVKKYNIEWVIGTLNKPDELVDTALKSGLFSLAYVGNNSALLNRNSTEFPISTVSFIHPECLESFNLPDIEEELRRAKQTFPPTSPLVDFLAVAERYFSKKEVFSEEKAANGNNPYVDRLLNFLARREKRVEMASFYYAKDAKHSQDDKIAQAEFECQYNQCQNAESILNTVTLSGLRDDHIYRAFGILEKVRSLTGLKVFTDERIQKNKAKIEKYLSTGTEPHRPDWCHLKIWPR